MKSAKEMFEELGYHVRNKEIEKEYNILCYTDEISYQTINFWLNEEDKFITMGNINKNFEETLKAINKQVEELNWK